MFKSPVAVPRFLSPWLSFSFSSLGEWTKLFSWIHHDRRNQAETLRLSSKFLNFPRRDLPSSAEQVQAMDVVRADVDVCHQTVCAGRPQGGHRAVVVVKTDAAAIQRDVGADGLADVSEAEMTVNGESSGVVSKDDGGRVSLPEPLLVRPVAEAACNQHPSAQQMVDIHPVRRPCQVVAGQRG